MFEEEELYWFRRSHEKWLLEGDNNPEYFHRIANGEKRKQTIYSLKNGDQIVQGSDELLKLATKYYKELFGPGDGNMFDLDPNLWLVEENVAMSKNDHLTSPFSEKVIKSALFQMERNKAAGPDGMPIEFFQARWGFIKSDMIDLFIDFYVGTLDIKMLNYGIITLLPKVKGAEKMQQYRSICLLKCLYKWITKCLTIRLEVVAGRIIHIAQTAF
jgi:hypothetical protein